MPPPRPPSISLRPISSADKEFLREVYGATRAEELALVDWDDSQKAAFVSQQFDAQHHYYHQQYPDGSFQVVLVEGRPAGRLYVNSAPDDTRIVDIAVLPEFRGRGVGTSLLARVLSNSQDRGAAVTIHVERNNPALRWYTRLGFMMAEDRGVYLFLRWQPPTAAASREPAKVPQVDRQP